MPYKHTDYQNDDKSKRDVPLPTWAELQSWALTYLKMADDTADNSTAEALYVQRAQVYATLALSEASKQEAQRKSSAI